MQLFLWVLEIIGTIAFAISGAIVGIKREMDMLGVAILGLTTAVGGGVIRDLILGQQPPRTFRDPICALIALAVSLIVFASFYFGKHFHHKRLPDMLLLIADSFGLGIFTVNGVAAAMDVHEEITLLLFSGVLTGVGGGVLRDMTEDPNNVGEGYVIAEYLINRGYSDEDILKILGGNLMRVLEETIE